MNRIKKILLLVEGAKLEVNLLNKAFHEYNLDFKYEIYPYKTNIYERMFDGNETELDTLDLLRVLKERDPDNLALDEEFSDILLVFDYEPQDNRFSEERISLMQNYFNESTDNGKLYINYPMCESFKHLKSNPDNEYIYRMVDLSIVTNGKYKELVGKETKYPDLFDYQKSHFDSIIIHNIKKAYYITKNIYNIKNIVSSYYELEPVNILNIQNQILHNSSKIYVLNTCLFFICDYNMDLIISQLRDNIG